MMQDTAPSVPSWETSSMSIPDPAPSRLTHALGHVYTMPMPTLSIIPASPMSLLHLALYCITPALVRYLSHPDRILHTQMMKSHNICNTVLYYLQHPCSHPSLFTSIWPSASIRFASAQVNLLVSHIISLFLQHQPSSTHVLALAHSTSSSHCGKKVSVTFHNTFWEILTNPDHFWCY